MSTLHSFWDWWNTDRIGASAAGVAVAVAVPGVWSSWRDRRERDRPMVALELKTSEDPGTNTLLLIMRNYGPVVAVRSEVVFDPPLPDGPMIDYVKKRFSSPILSLTPGQELTQVWAHFIANPQNEMALSENVPMRVKATITTWYGPRGRRHSVDEFMLAADVFGYTTFSESPHHNWAV